MRTPDEWWASRSEARKAEIQRWLDEEMRGYSTVEVEGQMSLVHVDHPGEDAR